MILIYKINEGLIFQGSYGTDPGENKKMYNHSCDLMDNGLSGNYRFAGQELEPRE